jgi:predicted transcriptional regulator
MDSTAQIKNNLISRIRETKDLNFLKRIQSIFDSSEEDLFQLTNEQEKSIEIGREQIKNGNYSTHESVISEMKEWLLKK